MSIQSLGGEDILEEKMATQPTPVFLLGKIPWTEEPVGYQSMESKELDTTEQLNHHDHQTYKTQV